MGKMKGLGRGLDSIFVDNAVEEETGSGVRTLRMAEIDPKADQPRRNFDAEALSQLADSIAANGILQPILVRETGERYEIIAGERRFRAARLAGLSEIPALVLEAGKTFRHGYRNVVVVKKMTFPNDKVLTIEMTEKQISGRNISLNIDYEDVLSADSFSAALLEEE